MPRPFMVITLLVALSARAVAAGPFEILDADETHVTVAFTLGDHRFEPVQIDGDLYHEIQAAGSVGFAPGRPGSPEVPTFRTRIALPPNVRPVLTIVETDVTIATGIRPVPIPEQHIVPAEQAGGIATPVAERRPDETIYASGVLVPAAPATLSQPGRIRNLDTVALLVTPFRHRAGELVVARRVVVDVRFGSGREPQARNLVPVRRDRRAERLYARGVLNAEQARAWRLREAMPVSPALRTRSLRRGTLPEAKLRIAANQNELVRVTADRLAAAGWNATPPIEDLRVTTRDYHADSLDVGGDPFVETSIGIHVEDTNGNGTFDSGDAFVFYARDAKTQRGWSAPEDRYSWENVYWVSVSPGGGTAMPTRAWSPSGGAVTTPTSFEHWRHIEEQNEYYWYTLSEEDDTVHPFGRARQEVDHLFHTHWSRDFDRSWGGEDDAILRLPFEIDDPAPGSGLGLRAEWRGLFATVKRFRPGVYAGTGASSGFHVALEQQLRDFKRFTYDSNGLSLPSVLVSDGTHEFVTERYGDGALAVNWYEIGYDRLFVAHADGLLFTNGGATGRVRWNVSGFTRDDVLLMDVTDADAPVRIVPDAEGTTSVTISFEDDVVGERRYLARSLASVPLLPPAQIELDRPSNLADLSPGNAENPIDADYLVVVYDEFADALAPLIAHREAQGHVVTLARVGDVYDEFSGGLFRPEAIREFVRYCYRLHPGAGGVQPLYLLLVGDGSEDYYGVSTDTRGERTAGPVHVPSYMVIGNATDTSNHPLIASDHWFIGNPDGNDAGDEHLSSMMVGRLPTGSALETANVVSKILRYEADYTSTEDQPWRRRGLEVADDCYSGGLGTTGGSSYSGSPGESAFVSTSLRAIDTIRASGLVDFQVETFFLGDVLDTIPELGRAGACSGRPSCDWTCTRQYCRNVLNLDGMFISQYANRGHLFVTYQGHGNRSLISHEYVLVGNGGVGGNVWGPADGNLEDVERFTNVERWPIWFFFACHVAEFGRRDEARSLIGDCLAERLLFHPEAGSIASIASTGFEWLHENRPVHEAVFDAWFMRPHLADDISGEPGIHLGEIMFGAKNILAPTYAGMVESYITLGDPALRIDIAPPRFKVWQDQGDEPWDDPGAPEPLVAGAPIRARTPEATTASFAARVHDEVPIAEEDVRVGRRVGGVTTWSDPASYSLVAGEPDPTGAVRSYVMRFDAPLTASDYEYVFSATDHSGRTMELPVRSRVAASFTAIEEGRPPRALGPGAFVAAGNRVRVLLDSPVGLLGEDIALLVNGAVLDDASATPVDPGGRGVSGAAGDASSDAERGSAARSFVWQLEAVLDPSGVREGSNTLAVRWPGGAGLEMREIAVSTTAAFRLDRFFVYPNPFERETDVFYRVSRPAERARVRIYTLTGRAIRTLEQALPTSDLNRLHWDGRDEDGDAVANGVYFYQLELIGPDGSRTTEQGKLARVLGHEPLAAPVP